VVDDDDDIRESNARVLSQSGYHVDAAADGEDAWQALKSDAYDLLVTDNNMPKVSGVELLEKLHAARMALPAVMATGTFPEEELNRRPWIQPFATLLKPYTPDQLLGTVHEVLRETDSAQRHGGPPS
jgi:two-component system OmpR family response regulator